MDQEDGQFYSAMAREIAASKDKVTALLGFQFSLSVRMSARGTIGPAEDDAQGPRVEIVPKTHEDIADMKRLAEASAVGTEMLIHSILWAESGFQIVDASTSLGASMILTEFRGVEPRMPWRSFIVKAPRGALLNASGGEVVAVMVSEFGGGVIQLAGLDLDGRTSNAVYKTMRKLVDQSNIYPDEDDGNAELRRAMARLAGGTMLEMETASGTRHFSRRAMLLSEKMRLSKGGRSASHWVLTRPVRPCSGADVAAALSGADRHISVRTLVRGHWRRQVCGRGRADRKLIHIEPFWRGPEDGAMPIRPHELE